MDIGWKHGFLIDPMSKRVQCNYCAKQMNGGVYRLKQHIAGIGGNVAKCKQCPRAIVDEMKDYMAGRQRQKGIRIQHEKELREELSSRPETEKGKSTTQMHLDDVDDEDEDLSPSERDFREALRRSRIEHEMRSQSTREGGSSSASRPREGGSSSAWGLMDPFLHRNPSLKQPEIKHAMKGLKAKATSAKIAVKNIVKWFLHAGVPAHTASSLYFQTMIDSIAEPGPGVIGPSPKDIYGKHLLCWSAVWLCYLPSLWLSSTLQPSLGSFIS